ncbi:hypothetical protein [Desulfobacula sp.]|uniref:hypothetical protein n=1 Tax=Desulfobacula sp. TaxID=2593537 RepID=UPI00261C31C7|nr:hypothetical protein [Desulfobacula sp.]
MKTISKIFQELYFPTNKNSKLNNENKRKRVYFLTATSVAVPLLLAFGFSHLMIGGGLKDAWANFLTAGILIVVFQILRKAENDETPYRIATTAITFLFLYNVASGLYNGADILWLYIYPMTALFLLGSKEGIVWSGLMMGTAFAMIQFPGVLNVFDYSTDFKTRFIISMLVVTFFSWLFESLRQHFYERLQNQKIELEAAFTKIKTLSGMIPICASCKKIRDDSGYWNQIESYIQKHSEAEFSHGICPECAKKLYPDLDLDENIG